MLRLTEKLFDDYSICCDIIQMGKDYTLAVYGGDTPHVGSAVMSVARQSLTGEGIGVTTSVLTGMGHKDDIVAKIFAETIAKLKNCTAVCSCGIHVDDMNKEQIECVKEAGNRLLQQVVQQVQTQER